MQKSAQTMFLGSTLDPKVGLKTGDQEVGDFHAPALGQAIATPTHSRSTGLSSGDVVAELNDVCDDLVQAHFFDERGPAHSGSSSSSKPPPQPPQPQEKTSKEEASPRRGCRTYAPRYFLLFACSSCRDVLVGGALGHTLGFAANRPRRTHHAAASGLRTGCFRVRFFLRRSCIVPPRRRVVGSLLLST